jgi:hypothetical protein
MSADRTRQQYPAGINCNGLHRGRADALQSLVPHPYLTIVEPAFGVRMPSRFVSTDDLNAAIKRVAPDLLALLADGVPRSEAAIVKALAGRHPKEDVKRALARLDVLGQLDLQSSKYVLVAPEPERD